MTELFLDETVNHIMMNILLKCWNWLDFDNTADYKYTGWSAGDVNSFDVIRFVATHTKERSGMFIDINITNHLPKRDIYDSDVCEG